MRIIKQVSIIIFSVLLGIGSTAGLAQETETLFSNDVDHGGFGGLIFGGTTVNGELSYPSPILPIAILYFSPVPT